jgi:hypothetical protein
MLPGGTDDSSGPGGLRGVRATAQLLTCTVPEGSCSLVEDDLGTFADLEGHVALPTGEYAG